MSHLEEKLAAEKKRAAAEQAKEQAAAQNSKRPEIPHLMTEAEAAAAAAKMRGSLPSAVVKKPGVPARALPLDPNVLTHGNGVARMRASLHRILEQEEGASA